ncbi:hypothetical protein [Dethiothermospora halolimnae]|uniref:hypothetical protein n=1 Tax=Dethiothermospora halolimnae TaxID=3114390 RepID=UPI003CCC00B0
MKKILIVIMCIILAINLIGCDSDKEETINKDLAGDKKEITIVVKSSKVHPVLRAYKQVFETENNVEVKFEEIKSPTEEEYLKRLNTKLYLDNGPTLIMIGREDNYNRYVEAGIALEVKDKISNLEKLYDGFKSESVYYVPIAMLYLPIALNLEYLDYVNMDKPNLDWGKEEYIKIKNEWLKKESRPFSYREYLDIVKSPLEDLDIFNENINFININTDKVKKYIRKAKRSIFSDNYILKKGYSYDKYSRFDNYDNSKEIYKLLDFNREINSRLLSFDLGENGLKIRDLFETNISELLVLPDIMKDQYQIETWGFIVNRNGKNIELGYKFINGLLKNQQQINIYTDTSHSDFPVNKDIEEEIRKVEKEREIEDRFIELKEYILDKFNNREYKVMNSQDGKKVEFYDMLEEDLVKIIFDEKEYSDEELSRKLQKLEDKYNMWLTE